MERTLELDWCLKISLEVEKVRWVHVYHNT